MVTKYPNQIDSSDIILGNLSDIIINIENILGTNPNGKFSTVNDRLNDLDHSIRRLNSNYNNLNLSKILSIGNSTDGFDIILGPGDVLTGIANIVNIKGNTTIDGTLDLLRNLDLNGNRINNLLDPVSSKEPTTKNYVDNIISPINNFYNNIKNEYFYNNKHLIQYGEEKTDPLPKSEANKFLKRKNDNSGWEFEDIALPELNRKINFVYDKIQYINKNISNGNDIFLSFGDAIKSEDGFINLDGQVVIHKSLSTQGNIDVNYNNIKNIADPKDPFDAINKRFLESKITKNVIITDSLRENQFNYFIDNLFTATTLRLDGESGIKIIHGIKFPNDYVQFNLINIGNDKIVLENSSDDVEFGNKILLSGNKSLSIPINGAVTIWYDLISSCWRVINTNF